MFPSICKFILFLVNVRFSTHFLHQYTFWAWNWIFINCLILIW